MDAVYTTYRPDGFSTVNSYLFVEDPPKLIAFLEKAFYAKEINRTVIPSNGEIANCILRIGDSCIMVSQARGQFLNMRAANYLYVNDVDEIYKRAIENGATAQFEPMDMDYGDRQGGVVDPAGNYWWISKRLKESGYEN